ncbi:2'-5' RNA ligase family protein [Streptomyces sp. ME18-1-4]|uniref:2'-5' RNA ligase family protein n=1 Tax=Streptomyces sp. ME18-1-4 TaxID=3028685 RepID=UPI0029AC056D|nr:2'-5' RNA ligase family protein [Streptomyces sp. ME18-1-4]MDX3245837.1 2'-5' RNA ligase family protein [Streptomyces sp. ME18-1-4]
MASPDYSDGCMIALYPPLELAQELAVDGGLSPEEMHVTVCYLGDAADIDADALREVVADLAERQPITAQISGHARFTGGDKDVLVALVDSAALEDLRRDTLAALASRGIDPPRDHGYCAHLTIQYLDLDAPAPLDRLDAQPVEFTTLSAVHGTDRTDYPLEHPMAAPSREAFAAGWALSGGPLTERVKAASIAAVQTAIERADDPTILEVTIDLGRLEGMWALLFQRREEKQAEHTRLVADAWRPLITRDAVAAMVDRYRSNAGLTETARDFLTEALAAARAMLQALADLTGWTNLRTTIREAIAAGQAEGIVNAVAIAAERAGTVGLDWNLAFEDAYQSLAHLDELWGNADGWLGRMVDRAAGDLGRMLAEEAEEGASRDAMIDAAMDILASDDVEAVAFTVDWAMTTAADDGALRLYRSEGVQQIDVITAGDGRVCSSCIDYEANSPWSTLDVPRLPTHPVCRCCYAASVSLANFAAWFA